MNLVGESMAIRRLIQLVSAAARSDSTVLLQGETGTGKELVARGIHCNSRRARGPFIAVNCGALPESLMESELFGYEKGAFTGASGSKPGEFELANGGTLFLDEVGELPVLTQAKLLRVLQQREVKRLGSTRLVPLDIRLVAATNRDLTVGFRPDLYYRLNVISLRTPPLRERPDDIPILVEHFLAYYASRSERHILGISAAAAAALQAYAWPGNVRELENCIERAVMMGCTDWIIPEDLFDGLAPACLDYKTSLAAAKCGIVTRAFLAGRGRLDDAARLLNLNRNYLYDLLKTLNLLHLRSDAIEGAL